MQIEPNLLTITRAAEFLKVSPDTLRRWEKKGIVTPLRTEGGSRRYTLLDLKIAKLNKKKTRLSQISSLFKQNYINHKRDYKIALFTSFIWIFGLLAYNLLTPVFLRPTNPEKQVSIDRLKEQARIKIASDNVFALPDPAPTAGTITPKAISQESDLLIRHSNNLPALNYTDNPNQYYSLINLNNKDNKNLTL